MAGISFEQGRKTGRLRLRLRDGADPLLQATGGKLTEPNDPYQLTVESDRYGVAEYVVDEVRNALLLDQVPSGPVDGYLLPGPSVPLSVAAGDGTASFDGEHVRLEWNWKTEDAKAAAGARSLALADITGRRVAPVGRPGERLPALHRARRGDEGAAEVRPQLRGAVGLQEGPADGAGRGGGAGAAAAPCRRSPP